MSTNEDGIDLKGLPARLKTLREKLSLSQNKMAEHCNLSNSFYGNLERGDVRLAKPSRKILEMLAKKLNISAIWLITGAGGGPIEPLPTAQKHPEAVAGGRETPVPPRETLKAITDGDFMEYNPDNSLTLQVGIPFIRVNSGRNQIGFSSQLVRGCKLENVEVVFLNNKAHPMEWYIGVKSPGFRVKNKKNSQFGISSKRLAGEIIKTTQIVGSVASFKVNESPVVINNMKAFQVLTLEPRL